MNRLVITNKNRVLKSPLRLEVCSSFFQKFRGLMFRKTLGNDEGIMLVEKNESVISSSIHMFFMRINLGVIWLNDNKKVVDKCVAIQWHPYYASKFPARYTMEILPSRLDEFQIGDQVAFNENV